LPGSSLGPRVVVRSAGLHDRLGTTRARSGDVFPFHLQFPLSAAGLVSMGPRLREVLWAWCLEIQAQARRRAGPHADETGWRVDGQTSGPWCFTTHDPTSSRSDRGRGAAAWKPFFKHACAGVWVTDFWAASNAVVRAPTRNCPPHLPRDLKRTEPDPKPGGDGLALSQPLKRLIRDSLRWSKPRKEWSAAAFAARRRRRERRLRDPRARPWENRHPRRWVKRPRRHAAEWFPFLDHRAVPSDHTHGARPIRPAVLVGKNSNANGSEHGAETQAVLRSVVRTLKQRGLNPISAVLDAVRLSLRTGQLPPLPAQVAEFG
jgi:transposase